MIIPKHLFADYIGAKSREAPTNLKPVGTGPYMFKDFKPGDMVSGVINPNYHMANRPLLRRHRDEGRRRCGLGGARGAADRRVRLRLEPAGRGRDPAAPGEGRQGPASSSRQGGGIEHIQLNTTDPWTEVDGERSSLKTKHPTLQRSGGAPGAGAAGRQGLGREVHLRPHRHRHGELRQQSRRSFRSKTTKYEFNVDKANALLDKAGWKKGADGIREKDGKKLKFVYQTSINQPRQKTQAIVKQACQKAGIDIEVKAVTASVFFSSDVANPDTYPQVLLRPADVQQRPDAARSRGVPAPVPVVGGRRPRPTSGRAATSRAGRTRNTTTPTRRRRSSSIRSSAPPC